MVRKREDGPSPSSPPPTNSSSAADAEALHDISNYKTPRPSFSRPKYNPASSSRASPLYFTASKKTPFSASSLRRRPRPSSSSYSSVAPCSQSKAARRLRAFEVEQSQSSRKVQIRRDRSLDCLARSMSAWLNFLFQNPTACGCNLSGSAGAPDHSAMTGKRESLDGSGVHIGGAWRSPKRRRDSSWRPSVVGNTEVSVHRAADFTALRASLQEVCSLEDLKDRMGPYLDSKYQMEVLNSMSHVTKNIDEGRLRIKANCPLVTDVRLKETAVKILLCYNLMWLRIGLHMVFGGDSLLLTEEDEVNQDELFLKSVIERQLLSHSGLAKAYAYNRKVEGLYRPGYFEALGNIILKRFLLLVLILDKAKDQSALPLKYGIDGLDGGSPLLFDCKHHIKSSRQLIKEFLSEVMHGEGDLIAHLVILGYKVNHQQLPIAEYNFTVSNLFEDIRDGVRLCRVVQLLKGDASILSKLMVQSDSYKKDLTNCGIAVKYLKEMGIPLYDEDGILIVADDLVNGDKELTLSLLWNIFVHIQVPLLIDKKLLAEEISKMKTLSTNHYIVNVANHMDMILEWIQAVCGQYQFEASDFASFGDGKALCYLVDYYIRKNSDSSLPQKSQVCEEVLILSDVDNITTVHRFMLSQRVTNILGNFPEINTLQSESHLLRELLGKRPIVAINLNETKPCEPQLDLLFDITVLQTSDFLEDGVALNVKSVFVLLIFLSSQLIGRNKLDQHSIHKILQWIKWSSEILPSKTSKHTQINECLRGDMAALYIQSHFRGWTVHRKYLKIRRATLFLQSVMSAWLTTTRRSFFKNSMSFGHPLLEGKLRSSDAFYRYTKFFNERHTFLWTKKCVVLIQSYARGSIARSLCAQMVATHRNQLADDIRLRAAIIIQSHWKGWFAVNNYMSLKNAVTNIQSNLRCANCFKAFREFRFAAIDIQRLARGQIARNRLLGSSSFRCNRFKSYQGNDFELKIVLTSILKLQAWWRRILWLKRRIKSAIIVQSQFHRWIACRRAHQIRCWIVCLQRHWNARLLRREFLQKRHASVVIQSCIRAHIARKWLIGRPIVIIDQNQEEILSKLKIESAIVIQSHVRGWFARREAFIRRHRIVAIQKYWKGCIVRKLSTNYLSDLRLRMQKSAANVNNSPTLMDLHVAALRELLSMKKVSSILQTCATLDMATENSQKCCERLVAKGAMNIVLQQIPKCNQSTPQLEVLKHLLSILRNLIRYPHLARVLITTAGSIEAIFLEVLRNKEEGYFIAIDILKKICLNQEGSRAIQRLPYFVKRLNSFVEDFDRKYVFDKRNPRLAASVKEHRSRRKLVATELLHLVRNRCMEST